MSVRQRPTERTCLFIDMAYSLDELRQRGHHQFFEARHSDRYFNKVIALHPLADRVTRLDQAIERKTFSDRQDVIEAKSAALSLPSLLAPVDFFVSQRRLLNTVSQVIADEGVSVIAATDPLYAGLFGLWLKRRSGLPLVIHLVANFDLNYEVTRSLAMPRMFPSRVIEQWVVKYVLRRADLVAAGSETLRQYAIAQGVAPERTELFRVAKNMVPAHRVPPSRRAPLSIGERERLGIGDAGKLLLTVARLEPVKMVDDSIRAFSIVAKDHPDALLLLAGAGSEREALSSLAHELGVAPQVRFLGLVDQDLLSRLAPLCVALSPLTGMALFETSMAGCPAIAYDCDSAVGELVETGVTGALIQPRDWQAMGKAAAALLGDPQTRRRLGKAMRARAEQVTDEKALYAHEHAVFDRLIGA
jgi:glycosyltransferase involved in cell wall biosynthesis